MIGHTMKTIPSNIRATAALVALLLASGSAHAGPDQATACQVEVLVFRNGAGEATAGRAPDPGTAAQGQESAEATALSSAALRLGAMASRLQRGPQYRLLLHTGWSLPVRGERDARPIPLSSAGTNHGIGGHITVYRGRYYHIALELEWRDPATGALHHLSQARRMKNGVVNYFDHPALGVIAVVRDEAPPERQGGEPKEKEE